MANFGCSPGDWDARCEEMNSFSEGRAREVMETNRAAFQWRHNRILSRVYPKATLPN